jgi:hypothetical protein
MDGKCEIDAIQESGKKSFLPTAEPRNRYRRFSRMRVRELRPTWRTSATDGLESRKVSYTRWKSSPVPCPRMAYPQRMY